MLEFLVLFFAKFSAFDELVMFTLAFRQIVQNRSFVVLVRDLLLAAAHVEVEDEGTYNVPEGDEEVEHGRQSKIADAVGTRGIGLVSTAASQGAVGHEDENAPAEPHEGETANDSVLELLYGEAELVAVVGGHVVNLLLAKVFPAAEVNDLLGEVDEVNEETDRVPSEHHGGHVHKLGLVGVPGLVLERSVGRRGVEAGRHEDHGIHVLVGPAVHLS